MCREMWSVRHEQMQVLDALTWLGRVWMCGSDVDSSYYNEIDKICAYRYENISFKWL